MFGLGVDGTVLEWFTTYLKDRIFRVCVNDALPDECPMKTGVPQRNIIGPILFLIYAIEFHCVLKSLGVFYHCYAGDTQKYFAFVSITEAENKLGVIFNKVDQ